MTEDEMVGQHQGLDGHKLEQVLGVGDEQGSLACCSAWGCEKSAITQQLNCQLSWKESSYSIGFDSWDWKSVGEVIDYPPQYTWASLVAQLVKNLPAVWETWV